MQQRYMTAQFGKDFAGCGSVGYRLFDSGGAGVGARTQVGVIELAPQSGVFGALVSLADDFRGSIVWDTGGTTPAFAIEEINPAPVATAPGGVQQDPKIMTGGSGSIPWNYQLLNQSGQPIALADVYATADAAGTRVVAFARTDAEGIARYKLDPGPVHLWRSRPGCAFTNPDSKTVEAA